MKYYRIHYSENKIVPLNYASVDTFATFIDARKALVNYNLRRLRDASKTLQEWDARMNAAIAMPEPPRETAAVRRRRARQSN